MTTRIDMSGGSVSALLLVAHLQATSPGRLEVSFSGDSTPRVRISPKI